MNDKEKTLIRYNKRLEEYGYNPKTLGWLKGRQGIRFSALTSIGELNKCSVLDVGCGFGDLYKFLKLKKDTVKYTGLELNPKLIEIGKRQYPKANLKKFDIEKDRIVNDFDWIIVSGLFNYKKKNPYTHIEKSLRKLFKNCKKGIAVDFMSTYVDYKDKETNYVSPEKLFSICKKICKRVSIRSDYMPYEFCIYLYKNNETTKNHVFEDFNKLLKTEFRNNKWLKNKNNEIKVFRE